MDTQDPPNQPCYQLSNTTGLIGLDNKTMSCYLVRKEVRCATWRVHSTGPAWPVETHDVFF